MKGRHPRRALIALLVLIAVGAGGPAVAAGPAARPDPGWFLPVGVNLGGRLGAGAGFVLGGEASVAHLFGSAWAGLWGDGAWDFGADAARLGAGVEAGWFVFGAELGWVAELGPAGGVDHGVRLGALLSGGLVTAYLRWSHLPRPSDHGPADRVELGALLKWPIPL